MKYRVEFNTTEKNRNFKDFETRKEADEFLTDIMKQVSIRDITVEKIFSDEKIQNKIRFV